MSEDWASELPDGWSYEPLPQAPESATLVISPSGGYVTILWRDRVSTLGIGMAARESEDDPPKGRGWRSRLVRVAVDKLRAAEREE